MSLLLENTAAVVVKPPPVATPVITSASVTVPAQVLRVEVGGKELTLSVPAYEITVSVS